MSSIGLSRVLNEYGAVDLEDARLDERLKKIVSRVALNPAQSFPDQMVNDADQEALYRFLRNPKVTVDALLAGHRAETLRWMSGRPVVRILHDTSEFVFQGERERTTLWRLYLRRYFARSRSRRVQKLRQPSHIRNAMGESSSSASVPPLSR